MITLYIGSALDPKEVLTSREKSVRELFRENQINIPNGAIVTLNARRLGDAELDAPINSLGVSDEDLITITEKLASA